MKYIKNIDSFKVHIYLAVLFFLKIVNFLVGSKGLYFDDDYMSEEGVKPISEKKISQL